jgi:hypothetical protein
MQALPKHWKTLNTRPDLVLEAEATYLKKYECPSTNSTIPTQI